MATGAAFFDLDRTLLSGASGPVFSQALKRAGVVPDRNIPGEGLLYRIFDTVGETLPAMLITRQMARVANGWDREAVSAAGKEAAERLVDQVQPYAHLLIERHREEGRPVVMATTSPYHLVAPLADALGIDHVLATRYGERAGRYDGTIDGPFVWGPGKLAAVRAWARDHGVSVDASWAYSDSIYDLPLLNAVGHPVAVNPDPRLQLFAAVRRWPVQFLDVPPGVPKLAGLEPQQVALAFTRPQLYPYVRFDVDGVDHLLSRGPAIVVANHRSYFDPVAIAYLTARAGRPVRFLGKKEVFDAPIVGQLAKAFGGIRVERGSGSDEPLAAAAEALAGGQVVVILPEGTIPRGPAFFDPELKGRWGAARLAATAQVPVIPVGLWGTEQVWPRNARVPNVLNVFDPPTVRIRVGPPVKLPERKAEPTKAMLTADTKKIMAAIADLLPAEARVRRDVADISDDELRRAWPAGYSGDLRAEAELSRRPGRD
ncbi:MAG: HAD-IB family hydrolase [Actinobacteria bacterium]|nr:HAD-IB family hydrolase [Actinomycetota bacterium]